MSTKKKRDEPDEGKNKQPKKPTADEDEGDEDDAEVNKDVEKVNIVEFLEDYQTDKIGKLSDLQFFVTRLFESYVTDSPLEGVYISKKTIFPEMMIRLRKRIVEKKNDEENMNFTFNFKNGKTLLELSDKVKFDPLKSISQRLVDNPDEILIYSLTDLACLIATLKAQRQTLSKLGARKTGDVSGPIVAQLVEKLEKVQANAISKLRALPGTLQSLKDSRFLFKGQPLSMAVQNLEMLVKLYSEKRYDGGAVAIYFDFADATISTVNALHIEVPSVRQLDEAYESMRQHPTRVILLDMRENYKRSRPLVN